MTEQEMEFQQKALPLRAAYAFGAAHGLEEEVTAIKEMVEEWDLAKGSSLRRGFIVELFQNRGVFEDFKAKYWTFGNTRQGERRKERYLRLKQRYEDFLAGRSPEGPDGDEVEEDQSFAQETDLRDFLAKHPGCIERGLTVYNENGRSGVEFRIERPDQKT